MGAEGLVEVGAVDCATKGNANPIANTTAIRLRTVVPQKQNKTHKPAPAEPSLAVTENASLLLHPTKSQTGAENNPALVHILERSQRGTSIPPVRTNDGRAIS